MTLFFEKKLWNERTSLLSLPHISSSSLISEQHLHAFATAHFISYFNTNYTMFCRRLQCNSTQITRQYA